MLLGELDDEHQQHECDHRPEDAGQQPEVIAAKPDWSGFAPTPITIPLYRM
jgi:hypothetical protein